MSVIEKRYMESSNSENPIVFIIGCILAMSMSANQMITEAATSAVDIDFLSATVLIGKAAIVALIGGFCSIAGKRLFYWLFPKKAKDGSKGESK